MSVDNLKNYSPTDPELIDKIVNSIKAKGIFDQFRRDCLADVDTKPAYQNLQQRVNGTVSGFLATQKWQHGLNKTQLRESLRRHTVQQAFLEVGVDRIVDQVVNPKIFSVFMPKVEDVVCECLGIEKPKLRREPEKKLSPSKKPSPPPSPYREREKTPPPVPMEEKIEEEKNEEPPQDLPKSIEEPSPVPAQSSGKENPELPEDLEPVSPASEPEVVNNDDDSNTFDEMPLLAALIDADSNHVESTALDSAPQTCITKSGGPSELSNSHSMLSTRPQLEYDTSTNNLSSLKSDDKLSPTKKFDNFSNLGEKLKQSDVNLRETSANKNDDEVTVVDLTELSGSPNDQLKADESKIIVLDESNTSSADNKIEPAKNELLNNDLSYSNDSFSSSAEPTTIKSDESKTEFSPVSKYSNHKKLGNSPQNATKSMKNDEDKDHNDKAVESKKKDKGKTSKRSSQEKSSDDKSKGNKEEKHKSQHDTSNIRTEKSSKQDNEKDRKDKTVKSDKMKTEETKVNDNKYSSKKKKEETSHSSKPIKDSKSDRKMDETPKTIEKDKYKDDKDKKSDHAKVRNESTSSVNSSKADKKKTDKTAGEDKSKSSRKRKSGRCNEDGDKSKNPRRSSDRDGSGSGSSGKPKPNNSLKSEAKKSTSDKGRSQHKSKNSSKSNTENESQMSATEEDEVERMLIEINNSIEDESLRVDMSELLGETVKKPKIANNFHEMKRIIKFRKHHVEKEVNSSDNAEAKNLMDDIVPDESDIPLDDPELLSSPNESSINVCNKENPINEAIANTNAVNSGLAKQMGLKQLSVLVEDVMKGSSGRLVPNSSSSITAEMTIDSSTLSSTVCEKAAVNDDLTFQLMDSLDRSSGSNEKSKLERVNAKESEITLDDHVQDTLSSLNSKAKLVSESTVIDESSKHESEISTKRVEDGFQMSDEKNPTSLVNPSSKTESVDDSNTRSKKYCAREPNYRKSTPSLLSDRSRRKNAGSLMYAILEEVNGPKIKEGEAGNVPSPRANKRKIKSEQKSLAEPSKSNESVARSDSCSLDDGSDISNKENDETNVSSKGKPKNDAATTNMSKQIETLLNRKKSQMHEGELCKSDNNSKELIYAVNNKHSSNDSDVIDAKRSTAPLNLRNAEPDVTFGPLSCSQAIDRKRMKENRDAPQMIDRKINATHHSMENVRIGSYLSASLLRRKSCPAIFHSGDNVDCGQALQDNEARTGKVNQSSHLFKSTRNPSVETLTAEPATAITCVTKLTESSPAIESESAEVKSKATLPPKELINGGINQFREVDGSSDRMTVKGRSVGTSFHNQKSIRKSKRLTKPESDSGIHTSSSTCLASIDNASNTEEIPVDGSSVTAFNKNSRDAVPTETLNNAVSVPLTSSWLDDSTESEFKGFSGDEGCFDGDEDFGGFTDDDIQKAFDQLRILQNSGPNKPSRTSTEMNSSTLRTTRAIKKIASEDSTIHLSAIVKELSCTKILEREDSSLSKCKATSKDSGLCDSPEMEKSEELYSEVESTDFGVSSQRTTRTTSSRKLQMSRHSDLLLESPPAKTRTLNTRKSRVTQSYETNDLYKPRPSLRSHR